MVSLTDEIFPEAQNHAVLTLSYRWAFIPETGHCTCAKYCQVQTTTKIGNVPVKDAFKSGHDAISAASFHLIVGCHPYLSDLEFINLMMLSAVHMS